MSAKSSILCRQFEAWAKKLHYHFFIVLSWSWVIYHYKLGETNKEQIKLSSRINEISSYQIHRLSIDWPLSPMPSGVNYTAITTLKMHMAGLYPNCKQTFPPLAQEQWCLTKMCQQIIQRQKTGQYSPMSSGLPPMLRRHEGCSVTNQTKREAQVSKQRLVPSFLSPGSSKLRLSLTPVEND